jgi:hypothetical protein
MKRYLVLFIILCAGCANNWLNLKQSEMLLINEDPSRPLARGKRQLPITTWYGPLGDESIDAYKQAINIINNKAGCEIFKQPVHRFSAPVMVAGDVELKCWNRIADPDFLGEMAEPEDEERGLCENWYDLHYRDITHSETHIPCYRPFKEVQVRTAVHELMHALGFGHDRELGTVLYRGGKFTGDDFQEADLNILRNYYCGNATLKEVTGGS